MNRRIILFYWLLLFVPTLIIGGVAFRMIRHEGERITEQTRMATLDRLRAIADNLRLAVSSVEDELTDNLKKIPVENLAKSLYAWQENNPLVRNVFIWNPKTGLQLPPPKGYLSTEEQRFIGRYDAFFSGRIPWLSDSAETNGAPPSPAPGRWSASTRARKPVAKYISKSSSEFVRQVNQMRVGNLRLAEASRPHPKLLAADNSASRHPEWAAGWIPWFTENRLSFLGWVQRDPESLIYGIEMEFATLLSRLIITFPSAVPQGTVFALMDGEGQSMHESGKAEIKSGTRPDLAVPLAPYLPHWQVVAYFTDGTAMGTSGHGFVVLSGLLLVIFIVAILAGGTLLTWQAHRHLTDALQKTSFVSNISHELKTPLTSIRMYAELLNEGRIQSADKTRHYLQVIATESQRLTRLVNNVLDFSRLEQGKKKYRQEPLELTELLRQFLEAQRIRLQEAGLVLHAPIPDECFWVQSDRDALEQVLLNLVDNAVKYAADGGELQVTLQRQDDHCRLCVMDRGPGISAAHREKIFENFYRVDDSLTTRQPGSGLGLSIARRLLRDLGGDLLFEARDGGGSFFVIQLPCIPPPGGPPEKEQKNT